ncbi:MAG: hypothetical protein ACRDQZ_19455 [Mycobacteriales bacterium]
MDGELSEIERRIEELWGEHQIVPPSVLILLGDLRAGRLAGALDRNDVRSFLRKCVNIPDERVVLVGSEGVGLFGL